MDILKPDPNKPFMSALKIVLVIAVIIGVIAGLTEGLLGVETNLTKNVSPALGLGLVILYFYFRSQR